MMEAVKIYCPAETQERYSPHEAGDGVVTERWQRWNDPLVREFGLFLKYCGGSVAALGMAIAVSLLFFYL